MSDIEDVIALSPLQEGLFSLSVLSAERPDTAGGGDVYTIPLTINISGPLRVDALRAACEQILVRHPNLRAIFWDTDVERPVQIVPSQVTLPWHTYDFTPEQADAFAAREVRRVFDLRDGPSLCFNLIRLPDVDGEQQYRLLVTVHHILMDGWSLGVFFAELLALYSGGQLAPVRPYRDYIAWLAAQDQAAMTARWADKLGGLSAPLMFAQTAGAGVDVAEVVRPEALHYSLDAKTTAALNDWARRQGVTLNTAVQFAWTLLLSRLTDRPDVVYGAVVTGRPHQVPDAERMIGLFLNTIPVPFVLDGAADVAAECQRLQRESSELREIGYLSLSTVQRATGHSALFDTMFVFQNAPMDQAGDLSAGDVTFTPAMSQNLTHYPLTVVAHLLGDELIIAIEAIASRIPVAPETIADLLLDMLRRLPQVQGMTVDQFGIVGDDLRAEILAASHTPAVDAEVPADVFELFARQTDSTPDALALTDEQVRWTYRDLHERALRLAGVLIDAGVQPEDYVAICLPRGVDSVVAILAAFAAGAAYVPVDLALPAARVSSILGQTNPAALLVGEQVGRDAVTQAQTSAPIVDLADPATAARLRDGIAAQPARRRPGQAAYAIFTSGSTGEPKGVVNHDAALASYFADHLQRVYSPARGRLGRPLTIAHAWSLSFDASWQPLVGLFDGHRVHLFDEDAMRDTQRLVEGIAAQRVDMIDTTPSMFRQLAHAGLVDGYGATASDAARGPLSVLALGGEAIDADLWDRLRGLTGVAVHNCYGPTETTVEAVVANVTSTDAASPVATIGRPTAGMSAYVLDSQLRLVPDGVAGELYLAGPQVTRGYLRRPRETAHRFIPDPFVGSVALGDVARPMYRTGDLVRRLASGALAYLGRADDQVKVRGYRIEIGEIENALRTGTGVRDAAAVVVRRAGGASLVGFVVAQPGQVVEPVALRAEVAQRLPSYMIPARLIVRDELPVTANGKQDTRALTELARVELESAAGTAEPETETEQVLADVLAEVFGGTAPGVTDDFFDLGLDSIVVIAVATAARARGLRVSVRMIATAPNIRDLAALVDSGVMFDDPDIDAADFAAQEVGVVEPLPYPRWMFAQPAYRRLSHTVVVTAPAELSESGLALAVQAILDAHGVLRSTVIETEAGPRQQVRETGAVSAADVLSTVRVDPAAPVAAQVRAAVDAGVARLDPVTGSMVAITVLQGIPSGDAVVLTIHHLAVDVVSWTILIPALAQAYAQVRAGQQPTLLGGPTSYRRFSAELSDYAQSAQVLAQEEFWSTQLGPDLAVDAAAPSRWSSVRMTQSSVSAEVTEALLGAANRASSLRELLLTALVLTLTQWQQSRGHASAATVVALESHGRGVDGDGASQLARLDPSGTVGWFTSVYPVRLADVGSQANSADPASVRAVHARVLERLAAVPGDGLGYGLLRDVLGVTALTERAEPEVEFNYLGRLDLGFGGSGQRGSSDGGSGDWAMVTGPEFDDAIPSAPEPDFTLRFPINVVTAVQAGEQGPELVTTWRWSADRYQANDIDDVARLWQQSVAAVCAALDVTEARRT